MTYKLLILSIAFLIIHCAPKKTETQREAMTFIDTTITNQGTVFKITAISNSDTTALLKYKFNGGERVLDTLDQPTSIGYFEVIDFDKNGSSDILLDYIGNNSSPILYLYNSTNSSFTKIDRSWNFPEAQQLEGNNQLYYSYHRAGCADSNWVSDLFTIEDFRITHLAHFYAAGCEGEQQQISVYKIVENNSDHGVLLENLPFSAEQNDSKDEVMRAYWNENYAKFL